MKIIVAGYPKTGTTTLCAALRILGYTVYDFEENSFLLVDEWIKIFKHGWSTEDFKKMYENIDAVTDYPPCCFWEEILKAFPDSKIILMLRDEDAWYKSMKGQMREFESKFIFRIWNWLSPTGRKMLFTTKNFGLMTMGMHASFLWKPFGWTNLNKEMLKMKYRAHNAYVLQAAPPEKLLVFKVTEGWKSLCNFLDKSIPNEPFPHKNKDAAETEDILNNSPIIPGIKREIMTSISVIAIFIAVLAYLVLNNGI